MAARPQCTHITMDRLRGTYFCDFCFRVPSMGWLYVCRQGHDTERPLTVEPQPINHDQASQSDELELLGFSQSVIDLVKMHHYTPDELEVLKAQKRHLKSVIASQIDSSRSPTPFKGPDDASSIANQHNPHLPSFVPSHSKENTSKQPTADTAHSGYEASQAALSDSQQTRHSDSPLFSWRNKNKHDKGKLKRKSQQAQQCVLHCCHTCRPYFKDRAYLSFGAVFADEVELVTPWEVRSLPMSDAKILRNIGLRTPPSQTFHKIDSPILTSASQTTMRTSFTDLDVMERARQVSSQFYSLRDSANDTDDSVFGYGKNDMKRYSTGPGIRASLKGVLDDLLRGSRESSSDGSCVTLPFSGTGVLRGYEQDVEDFDLSIFRRLRERESGDLIMATRTRLPNASQTSLKQSRDDASQGDEVEVDGGVALTEEAVETHTPDIITQA